MEKALIFCHWFVPLLFSINLCIYPEICSQYSKAVSPHGSACPSLPALGGCVRQVLEAKADVFSKALYTTVKTLGSKSQVFSPEITFCSLSLQPYRSHTPITWSKEWSASAKLGVSGRLRVPSFARNISNTSLLEVIGTAIPPACQVAYETELNAMHIAAGLGSCEAMEALTHGTNDEELPSYLAYLAIWCEFCCLP